MRTWVGILMVVAAMHFGTINVRAQTDSCLKMYWISPDHIQDPNPDSVMADSCIDSPTYGELYARQWFYVVFSYNVLPTPVGPVDTIIERTWQDIDTTYSSIRTAFDSLDQKFGNFILVKKFPSETDTSIIGSHWFNIQFDTYANIDSVVSYLKNIPMIDTAGYDMRMVVKADVKDEQTQNAITKTIYLSRNQQYPIELSKLFDQQHNVRCYDISGRLIISTLTKNMTDDMIIRTCKNGTYIFQDGQHALLVLISD